MEKLERYRDTIDRVLADYALWSTTGNVVAEKVIDQKRNHFEILRHGWRDSTRIHGSILHIDLQGDKIWIQHDGTDRPVADQLEAAGIPKSDIVLGFIPAEQRSLTGYAVG